MWTYEQRMKRVTDNLINNDRIDRVETYKRAKFFGKYAFRVNLWVSLAQWVEFDQLMQDYRKIFEPLGAHLVGVKSTFDIYVYGNDPAILTYLLRRPSIILTSLVQTDPTCWGKALPKATKNTGKFFGEFRYRIRMRDIWWGLDQKNIDQLDELEMNHKLVLKRWHHTAGVKNMNTRAQVRDTFVYVRKLNEVLVLKLMFGDQVTDVVDRN